MVLLMLLALVLETGLCQDSSPCTFNSMCSCRPLDKTKLRDVTCVGVPLARVPGEANVFHSTVKQIQLGPFKHNSDFFKLDGSKAETLATLRVI